MHTHKGIKATNYIVCMLIGIYVELRTVNKSTPCEAFVHHTEGRCLMWMQCAYTSYSTCHQKPNPSSETVPLTTQTIWEVAACVEYLESA